MCTAGALQSVKHDLGISRGTRAPRMYVLLCGQSHLASRHGWYQHYGKSVSGCTAVTRDPGAILGTRSVCQQCASWREKWVKSVWWGRGCWKQSELRGL